jgi:hypothetical protein
MKDENWLLKRTLYGLCCSLHHWYMKIKSILNQPGLHQNAYDQHLFTSSIIDPSNPADTPSSVPLTLGLYLNDFVYFLEDSAVKAKFQQLLNDLILVEFMGTVKWFLGMHFQWSVTPNEVQVHLSQTSFAAHLVEEYNVHMCHITLNATPYCSGLPIDAISESDEDDQCTTFQERKQKYQVWLA